MEEEFPVEVDGHGRPDGKPNSFPRRVVFYSPPSWPKTEQRPAAKYFLEGRKFQTLSSVHNIETPDEIIDWPDNGVCRRFVRKTYCQGDILSWIFVRRFVRKTFCQHVFCETFCQEDILSIQFFCGRILHRQIVRKTNCQDPF